MKKILVGLDGSPRHHHVLSTAADMARRLDAELVLLRAVGLPTELPPEAYLLSPNDVTKTLETRARADLDAAKAELAGGIVASCHVVIGTPWQAICAAAKEYDVDLVVIGSHGYDALDRVIGTTAAKVVNHADRSVLVVRDRVNRSR